MPRKKGRPVKRRSGVRVLVYSLTLIGCGILQTLPGNSGISVCQHFTHRAPTRRGKFSLDPPFARLAYQCLDLNVFGH